jgi:hypothetical protein
VIRKESASRRAEKALVLIIAAAGSATNNA